MAFYSFKRTQKINASSTELWKFISDPSNLSQITPPEMDFKVTTEYLPAKMYPGLMISYLVRPIAGIPTKWLTEITHVKDGEYFVDEQRVGPYKLWHHQHQLIPIENGTLMRDIVTYQPPFSILGRLTWVSRSCV